MPVFIHLANLILQKKTVQEKYSGGMNQFCLDFLIDAEHYHQVDNELISLAGMNCDEFDLDIKRLTNFNYNVKEHNSNDFVIISRYGGALWNVDWLQYNNSFAWHINANPEHILKAEFINSEMTMDEISDELEKGNNLFETIK